MISSRDSIVSLPKLIALHNPVINTGDSVDDAFHDASLLVYLRCIESMNPIIFNVHNRNLELKLKGLLSLVANRIFNLRYAFTIEEQKHLQEFMVQQATGVAQKIFMQLDAVESEATLDKEKLRPTLNEYVQMLDGYFNLRESLFSIYSRAPSFYRLADTVIDSLNTEDSQETIFKKIFDAYFMAYSHASIQNVADEINDFDVNLITEKLFEVNREKNALLNHCKDFPPETFFAESLNSYISMLANIKTYLLNTAQQVMTVFPDFTVSTFFDLFQKAFHPLQYERSDELYYHNYALEVYLQQISKPQHADTIRDALITLLIPVINAHLSDYAESIDYEDIVGWAQHLAMPGETCSYVTPPTVQEILIRSHTNLFVTTDHLQTPMYTRLLVNPPAIESTPDLEYISALQTLHSQNGQILISEAISQKESADLINSREIPPKITFLQISILNSLNKHILRYRDYFQDLSADIAVATNQHDRTTAVENFKQCFMHANTVGDIAALLEMAKPHINRHRHPVFDNMFGKHNTAHWSRILKVAREKALTLLANDANCQSPNIAYSINALNHWRSHSLFAEHRKNFKIEGGFGRTHAQKVIDEMIVIKNQR